MKHVLVQFGFTIKKGDQCYYKTMRRVMPISLSIQDVIDRMVKAVEDVGGELDEDPRLDIAIDAVPERD